MRIASSTTTREVLLELGRRLRAYRLQQNVTVAALAQNAGVAATTVLRAETGQGATLANVVRMLRALGRLDALDTLLPEPMVSPVQLAELEGRERRRARPASTARK